MKARTESSKNTVHMPPRLSILPGRPTLGKRLGRGFFIRPTLRVARDLLGCILVRRVGGAVLAGRIVEVEAYSGGDDPASHAYQGLTKRNRIMYHEGGYAYVYFTYGMHYCLNVSTERAGVPGAVLLRALEPLYGTGLMKVNRKTDSEFQLTNGPAKLTQAFRITLRENGTDMTRSTRLYIAGSTNRLKNKVCTGPRIGVRNGSDKKWRFYLDGNRFVSRKWVTLLMRRL